MAKLHRLCSLHTSINCKTFRSAKIIIGGIHLILACTRIFETGDFYSFRSWYIEICFDMISIQIGIKIAINGKCYRSTAKGLVRAYKYKWATKLLSTFNLSQKRKFKFLKIKLAKRSLAPISDSQSEIRLSARRFYVIIMILMMTNWRICAWYDIRRT